jgi:hypothetical protein
MRFFALAAILLTLPFTPACEQQKWEETKMFHEVPKKGNAKAEAAPAGHAAASAEHTASPEHK